MMEQISEQAIKDLQERVLTWFANNGKWFPWRDIDDPYHIFLSECMLQQTQSQRVISYYETFIEEFPRVEDLAAAPRSKVLRLWSGLGYNNRAIRLHESAKRITESLQGRIPRDRQTLESLPGVGPYTANAVLAFAFNDDVPVIDTNIRRVFIHELDLPEELTHKQLEEVAMAVLPRGRAREWYSALMDYGATVLTARTTAIRPKQKQPPFAGSTRQVRGYILRQLLEEGKLSMSDIALTPKDATIEQIVMAMEEEGLLRREGEELFLVE